MKNGTATGNDHINSETLKAGDDTISKTLAKLYTKHLSERRILTAWKNAKMVIIFQKRNNKDLNNYIPICMLSNIYKLLTKVLMNRLQKTFYENQPREQAGFRSRYSTADHIYAVNQLKEKCKHDTLHRIRRLRETLRLSAISSSTDFASRTGDRSCEH